MNEPTREKNVLDLIFTSEEGMIEDLEVREHFSTSDHNILCWKLITKTELLNYNVARYNYSRADYGKINARLNSIDWKNSISELDPENMWNTFSNVLYAVTQELVPTMKNKSKFAPAWMTNDVKKQRKYKARMWKRYKKVNNYNNLVAYKLARNKVTSAYKDAKVNFESKLAKNIKHNPKAFYSYIRSKTKTKDKVGPLKDKNGILVSDSSGMCKVLNEFFSSVFTIEKMENIPKARTVFKEDRDKMLHDVDITEDLLYQKLTALRENKAPGVDNLDSGFLKATAASICGPLTIIFLTSLECGIVPSDWKMANVCAIFKKGKQPENYRPVSLTHIFVKCSKVFERQNCGAY